MTIEEAIEIITLMRDMARNSVSTNTSNAEALDMAIRALKNEQTDGDLVKENTDLVKEDVENADKRGISAKRISQSLVKDKDLISRKEAIKQLENLCGECDSSYCGDCRLNCKGTSIKDVFDVLTELPSITPVIVSDIRFYDDYKAELSIRKKNDDLISRQSVITMLNKIENAVEEGDGFQFNEWIEYAKDIPSTEKTTITDTDLISRQAALKCFNIRELKFKDREDAELVKHYLELAFDDLAKLPSAEKTAEWLRNPDYTAGCGYYICSNCENDVYDTSDYCPNCGARMKGVEQ